MGPWPAQIVLGNVACLALLGTWQTTQSTTSAMPNCQVDTHTVILSLTHILKADVFSHVHIHTDRRASVWTCIKQKAERHSFPTSTFLCLLSKPVNIEEVAGGGKISLFSKWVHYPFKKLKPRSSERQENSNVAWWFTQAFSSIQTGLCLGKHKKEAFSPQKSNQTPKPKLCEAWPLMAKSRVPGAFGGGDVTSSVVHECVEKTAFVIHAPIFDERWAEQLFLQLMDVNVSMLILARVNDALARVTGILCWVSHGS